MRQPSSSYSTLSIRYDNKGKGTCYNVPKISGKAKNEIIEIIKEHSTEKIDNLADSISSLEILRPFISMIEYMINIYQQGKSILSAINYTNIIITIILVLVLKYHV
jgi:hypothetical protein